MHIVNQALYFLGSTYTDAFVTKSRLLQVNLFQKHLCILASKQKIVHWITSSVHENCELRTLLEHVVYINWSECQNKKQFVYTTHNCWFTEQSVVILWVSWWKNKSFWHRFTCNHLDDGIFTKYVYLSTFCFKELKIVFYGKINSYLV